MSGYVCIVILIHPQKKVNHMFHDQESITMSWYKAEGTATITWGTSPTDSATLPADNNKQFSIPLSADNGLNLSITGAESPLNLIYQSQATSSLFELVPGSENWTQSGNTFYFDQTEIITFSDVSQKSGLLIVGTIDISSDGPAS